MTPGKLFVIEGTDGSGKTEQTKALLARLTKEGHPATSVSFPRYEDPSAHLLQKYLKGQYGGANDVQPRAASILYAVDRYDASAGIAAALRAGVNVVANRYVGSNMAHQGSKIPSLEERRAFYAWLDELEYGHFGIPRPTLTLVLRVPAKIGQSLAHTRGTSDIHETDTAHLLATEQVYREMTELFPDIVLVECIENNALLPIGVIHERVFAEVQKHLVVLQPTT